MKKNLRPSKPITSVLILVWIGSLAAGAISLPGCGDFGNTDVVVNIDGSSSQTLRSKKIEVVNQEGIVVVRITAEEHGAGRLTVFDAMGEEVTVVP